MKLWQKILTASAAIGAVLLYFGRVFLLKQVKTHEDFPQNEKKRLQSQLELTEREKRAVKNRTLSDEEIERKYNK